MRPGESLKYDGNGGWRVDEAIRVARAMGDVDVYFEQPCATYEEGREARRTTGVPLILDESATDVLEDRRGCRAVPASVRSPGARIDDRPERPPPGARRTPHQRSWLSLLPRRL